MSEPTVEVRAPQYDESTGCEPMLLFWYVEPGAEVVEGQDLCEIETAKAVVVITAPCAGVLEAIAVGESQPVESEQLLASIRPEAQAAAAPAATVKVTLIGAPKKCAKCEACEALVARLQERFPGRIDYHQHTTDDEEAGEFGVVMPPFLVVGNLIVAMGAVPEEGKVAQLIEKQLG
jgi:pyruvate/2-oxoglutarate dehydrogenase complex dihydrolipoamide acyltransferase (E2) component